MLLNTHYKLLIKDWIVLLNVGIKPSEITASQRIKIHLTLTLSLPNPLPDDIQSVVCYDTLKKRLLQIFTQTRYNLLETVASSIADICLKEDKVVTVLVSVEKLDVYSDCSAGVELYRERASNRKPNNDKIMHSQK
ncbi:MAG TPA: dihydroneopterin aldolase [Alphaproteobacteria bacterium]|jgi:FolB domain-containing protein|nr:dihydroneopterin aldolase [Alphaproteobacteria bacterium]